MRIVFMFLLGLIFASSAIAGDRLIMKAEDSQKRADVRKEKKTDLGQISLARKIHQSGRDYIRYFENLSRVEPDCVIDASRRFRIPVSIILTILDIEGGEVGVRASNKNRTWDIGPMQINTCHMEELKPFDISEHDLQVNGCLNVQAGTWLLRKLLDSYNGKMLEAIGRYHSGNQPYKGRYQKRAVNAYRQLKANPLKHIDRILAKSNNHFENVSRTRSLALNAAKMVN